MIIMKCMIVKKVENWVNTAEGHLLRVFMQDMSTQAD